MNKAVLISIRPKWCEKIASGEKTIEVRKTRPKLDTPFKCYIYCTIGGRDLNIPISQERLMRDYLETGSMKSLNCPLGNGKVVGEFTCDRIYKLAPLNHAPDDVERQACLTREEIVQYLKGVGYGWHISNLKIYDMPRELSEFSPECTYKADDGTCPSRRVACSFQRYDYNQDGTINIVECGRVIKRAPQSWCYAEEG